MLSRSHTRMTRDLGQFDLIVVGGGVNGAGIARDAVGRGLSVLLCEKDDLAQGTSSRSGKLVHGGLRYLEYYEFRLVREALIEREVLLRAAPHIIWPMRFVLPHSPEQRPAWMVRAGLFLYDHLGGRKILAADAKPRPRKGARGRASAQEFQPRLRILGLLGGRRAPSCPERSGRPQAWRHGVDEDAAHIGATRRRHMARRFAKRERREHSTGDRKILVNAAGPWVEDVLHRAGRNAASRVRLVKGSHIVTRKFWNGDQAYLLQNSDKRVIFVNPYEGDLALIGTTDIPFEGQAEDVRIDKSEVEYLLSVVDRYFTESPEARRGRATCFRASVPCSTTNQPIRARSRATMSSMSRRRRAKPRCSPSSAARSPLIADLPNTRWRSFLPTFRRCRALGRSARRCREETFLTPTSLSFYGSCVGGAPGFRRTSRTAMPGDMGQESESLLDGAKSISDLGRSFGGTLYEREARFLAEEEWATDAEDILERRTKHALHLTDKERADFTAWFQMLTPQPV